MKIRNFEIGTGRTFIIAELCSNIIRHLDNLPNIIRWCKESGASAAKVQLFRSESFPENERESKKLVEFPRERFEEFVNLCHAYDLAAGASVFDRDAVNLVEDSGSDFIKLATREFNNTRLVKMCAATEVPVIRSFDVKAKWEWENFWIGERNPNIVHMICNPEYPSEFPKIETFGDNFSHRISVLGYSSHTSHWNDVIIAVSRGAAIVEKHVKIDKDDPEAGWSLYLDEFEQLVKDVRWTESVR